MQFGADRNAPYLAIRIERRPGGDTGVTEVTRVSMAIGDVTEDGNHRYAVVNETTDVILVDREWADQILDLFHGDLLVPAAG